MIAMSNLEEFAQAVGRDVKRFETDYTSKAELEAKDYIEGKSDYQILKHQVEELTKQNKVLQEQLALVKPAPRRAPMAYTIDLNSTPPIAWFDNGCGLDTGGNTVLLGKDSFRSWDKTVPGWDFPNAILRTSLAIIGIDVWKKMILPIGVITSKYSIQSNPQMIMIGPTQDCQNKAMWLLGDGGIKKT